jgi:hypothetical protein
MESRTDPKLPLEYFSLQLGYAEKAAQLSGMRLEQTLLEFTSFWRRIHNPLVLKTNQTEWSFDPATPQWRELCDRIHNNESADRVAYDLYLKNDNSTEAGKQYFGCFRYDFISRPDEDHGTIKIHFKNRDDSVAGPLSKERQETRLRELKSMFASISEKHPEAKTVEGGSWLYNLKSYQRLFPETFTSNMKTEEIPFPRSSGIWGQFINSEGQVNEKMKYAFLHKTDATKSTKELLQCFEFRILFPRTGIGDFYSYLKTI